MDQAWLIEHWAFWWILANFLIYLAVFVVALCINYNFNIIMVGMIYLLPLIPIGWETTIGPGSWCSRLTIWCLASSSW